MQNLRTNLAHLQIPLNDILSATNNFADYNLIKTGISARVYRGALLRSKERIDVVIRRFSKYLDLEERDFLQQIDTLSRLEHINTVSIIGFNVDNNERIMIMEHAVYGSLKDHVSNPTLTWSQRLKICLGAALGLGNIHNARKLAGHYPKDLYPDVKILLNKDWEAKVFCFGYPAKYSSLFSSDYTNGTSMPDVYSFGVILFEVLCGRKAKLEYGGSHRYLVEMATHHYDDGKLDDIINPDLRKQMNPRSLSIYSEIAYNCVKENRPPMNLIVEKLRTALMLQKTYETPEEKLEHLKIQLSEKLEHLKIQLTDIISATNNFHETCRIGEGGYGEVYKGELDVFDRSLLAKEIENENENPWRRTVAIKRIRRREDDLGNTGFLAELELLKECENPNIISLLGFCVEGTERILVFEYASNGSLDDYLERADKTNVLTWPQRLKMCLDIAFGINYLHTVDGKKKCIIHRDIKSANILLAENLKVKIADFGLSIFHPTNHPKSTINTKHFAGTEMYCDPEYSKTGKLKIESDIYSFGVVLFEILSGKLAYDPSYTRKHKKGLAPCAREHIEKGTLMEMVDKKIVEEIVEETHELDFALKIGPNQDSLDAFFKVACKCLEEAQKDRPRMEKIIDGLNEALNCQKNRTLKIKLEDIRLNGENFSDINCAIKSTYYGMSYDGEVRYDDGFKPVIVKRMCKYGGNPVAGPAGIWREFEIPFKYRHENVIGLIGYCKKKDENFIVYEYASNKSLDMHLDNNKLTWIKRLKICMDIANGLNFLHGGVGGQDVVIHRELKSSIILLTEDWKAKICGFDVSLIYPNNQKIHYLIDGIGESPGYCDPLYFKTRILTKESDIYSFGVILFELLCGRSACTRIHFLDSFVKHHYEVERPDKLVFEHIREQIVWESLVTFTTIAFQCLHDKSEERPTAAMVVAQLQQALEFQEGYEIWEAKLPINYNNILEFSNTPEIYSTMEKKDIYNKLSKGILLQEGKLWFSIGGNGERNERISARMFSYKNRWSHRWRSIPESRFEKVAELSDISNLNIEIKKSTQLLLPGVNYSVHLVFKFCCPRKSHAERMYVNLKYTMGNEKLNAYFATWREDGWMMIELRRFLNHEERYIEVLLKSISRCYCDSRAIYIEGIEFRAIDDVDEIEKSDKVEQPILKSNSEMDKACFSPNKMANMRHEVHVKWVLYNYSDVKFFNSNGASQSRFEGIELLRQSTFFIKWKINSQMVSPNTEHACYLVFKLSENCCGLHCPVIVRDQYHWKSKETLYFRRPKSWNSIDTDRVPKERTDGWMEVIVWIYNSSFELRNESLYVNLKLTSYEGTMSGFIVRSLEFRPMEK